MNDFKQVNGIDTSDMIIVDHYINKRGDDTTELKEHDGKLLVKHFSGLNTDNFVIKKFDGQKITFSFFKLNGIQYVNVNGQHLIDYKKFIHIQQISKVDTLINEPIAIKIKNSYIGDLIIYNCDVDVFHKALHVMNNYMKNQSKSYLSEFIYFLTK